MTKILWQSAGAFAIVLTISLASCVSDSCTECTGILSADLQTTYDTLICADQFDTRSEYENRIQVYETFEGTCIEQ